MWWPNVVKYAFKLEFWVKVIAQAYST